MESEGDIVWIGGKVDRIRVSLRIFDDELDPDTVSVLLGCQPTKAYKKGEVIPGARADRTAPTGMWILQGLEEEEGDLEDRINLLLDRVSSKPASWTALAPYRKDVFCSLHLTTWNRGCALSSGLMRRLSGLRLDLDLDIYAGEEKEK